MTRLELKAVKREFFAGFRGFHQDPGRPVSQEFECLAELRGWKPGSKKWKKNWNECMQAEYDRLIGNGTTSLETWQHLCRKIGLDDSLPSIRQCKMVWFLFRCWYSSRLTLLFGIGPLACLCQHR